ncbi:ABC transporter substrate-binding protein [Stappia sp. BW2]|uniref:ABC transporter substrate-binding protein n=1 Tax=Stappia sp. BW2 TaxID=2592622 RepID=UPI0011DECD5A|nr:ABC transporter substrate-binding protein [Stappia sp. BW2]TYC68977.1 ABC transporter substrate-binding protein [Stappia sp. BW2]
MKPIIATGAIALAAALSSGQAFANKADDTLHTAFSKELETTDFYFQSAREGTILARQVWDGLVYRDQKTGEYIGNLASSWEWIDDTTLEFKLREGIKFHNGEEFDADDVVYTVNYVVDPDNHVVVPGNVNWMESAEKIDKYTVRIHTKGPFPAALEYLAGLVSIYPNEYYAEVGPTGMGQKPVGTGPYMVESVDPGKHYVLKKYDDYHESPKGKASIGTIDIRTIPDVNTQMAELFSGGIDMIWNVPSDQATQLKAMDQFTVSNESTMRIGYITMDAAGRGGENPFQKKEVREAVGYAIDRQAIVDNLLQGSSKVVPSACYPSQFGCEQDVKAYPYDPEKAKELLAEAGYPDGFTIDFYAYRNRPYAEAMMAYLAEVGIKTDLNYLQYSALREMQQKGDAGFGFLTWGSNSIADVSAITSLFFKFGNQDFARDEEVKNWLDAGDTTVDGEVRKENYSKALKKIADEAYWIPLFSYNTNYVFTKEVDFSPSPDEIVRFFEMSWK